MRIVNPLIIVEVLSKSTASYDRTKKFDLYKKLPTFCDYLLVSQNEIAVTYHHKSTGGHWMAQTYSHVEGTIEIQSLDLKLPVNLLYEQVDWLIA